MLRPLSLLGGGVLLATDNMLPFQRGVQELQDLPLKHHLKEGWLGEDAARLFAQVQERVAGL